LFDGSRVGFDERGDQRDFAVNSDDLWRNPVRRVQISHL